MRFFGNSIVSFSQVLNFSHDQNQISHVRTFQFYFLLYFLNLKESVRLASYSKVEFEHLKLSVLFFLNKSKHTLRKIIKRKFSFTGFLSNNEAWVWILSQSQSHRSVFWNRLKRLFKIILKKARIILKKARIFWEKNAWVYFFFCKIRYFVKNTSLLLSYFPIHAFDYNFGE